MNLSNDQKFEILKITYQERRKEIAFPRDRSFQVTSWMVSIFLALSAGTTAISNKLSSCLIIPLFALCAITTFYLHRNHKVYCERLNRVADIEEALQFFENGAFVKEKSLNPSDLRIPKVTCSGTLVYVFAIWVSVTILVIQILSK